MPSERVSSQGIFPSLVLRDVLVVCEHQQLFLSTPRPSAGSGSRVVVSRVAATILSKRILLNNSTSCLWLGEWIVAIIM